MAALKIIAVIKYLCRYDKSIDVVVLGNFQQKKIKFNR